MLGVTACSQRQTKTVEPTFASTYEKSFGTVPDLTLICEVALDGLLDTGRYLVDLRRTTGSNAPNWEEADIFDSLEGGFLISPHEPEREFAHSITSKLVRDGIEIIVKARWSHWSPDNNSGSLEEHIVVPAHTDLTVVRGKVRLEAKWYPPN